MESVESGLGHEQGAGALGDGKINTIQAGSSSRLKDVHSVCVLQSLNLRPSMMA